MSISTFLFSEFKQFSVFNNYYLVDFFGFVIIDSFHRYFSHLNSHNKNNMHIYTSKRTEKVKIVRSKCCVRLRE